jgi:homogentisate 1,2-dioxygenase
MPFYLKNGEVPEKRHIQHYYNNELCYEEHISREGFSDIYSNIYHINLPTKVLKVGKFQPLKISHAKDNTHRHHHFELFNLQPAGNWISGRKYLLYNNEVQMSTALPNEESDIFFRNSSADEIIFIHHGTGTLKSPFGNLKFKPGDYIIIPLGTLYQMNFDTVNIRLLIIESRGMVTTPKRYRNRHGQLLEHAPFCERDIRVPDFIEPVNKAGEFQIQVRLHDGIQNYTLAHHPFDLVGWDGYYYPWIFNINDFMPITGKVHQPPPVHQTFEGPGFVICSFVPRLFDYHEKAIPAPYAHSNVESDEILYYVSGDFMSRKGVSESSVTLHPRGLPHGPQPGKYEGSIGKKGTDEIAVMLDTFNPLYITEEAMQVDDPKYPYSWLEEK